MTPVLENLLRRLQSARPTGSGWSARCPAHNDRQSSLSIAEGDDGRVLLKCFAGCAAESVVDALGLRLADLFPGSRNSAPTTPGIPPQSTATLQQSPSSGLTLQAYADSKQIPIDFLRQLGMTDHKYNGRPAVRIPYLDVTGTETAVRFRLALTGDDRFRWKSGAKPTLYGLSRVNEARKAGYVVLVEGESDCHTLWSQGIPAVGIPGASHWREDRDAAHLEGIDTIYIVIEPDRGGETILKRLATSSIRARVRLVRLDPHKDPSALYLAEPAQFRERFRAALDAAPPWCDYEATILSHTRREAWSRCEGLARDSRILDHFVQDAAARGVVGEERVLKLLYLVVTSRLLNKPVSAVVKGPSSAGKSFVVEQVLAFFPPAAFYALSAMSERALIYSEEPLIHRVLVIYEATGLQGDLPAYIVRSLLSEGRVRYETAEATKDGVRARFIEREGPTGLLLTTTAIRLHPENETRLFSIPITDTPEQTQAVLRAIARETPAQRDFTIWHALQEWLASGPCEVTIPYAERLAGSIPPTAVRLRRDFGALLNLIRTHAVLHQATRERATGRIVATLDDYAIVRDLVGDLVAEGVDAKASPTLRESVSAVAALCADGVDGHGVSVSTVARQLRLDKSAASRRLRAALERGYLKNLEDRKGRPARYVVGEPLPDDLDILPLPDTFDADRCSVAVDFGGIPPSPAKGTSPVAVDRSPVPDELVECDGCGAFTKFRRNGRPWCSQCAQRGVSKTSRPTSDEGKGEQHNG